MQPDQKQNFSLHFNQEDFQTLETVLPGYPEKCTYSFPEEAFTKRSVSAPYGLGK